MEEEEVCEDTHPLVPFQIERHKFSFMKSLWISATSTEFISLVVLTIHMSALPLLVRQTSKEQTQLTQNGSSPVKFVASTSVLMSEFFKLAICTLLIASVIDHPKQVFHKVYTTIVHNRRETAKICVPALIYAIQNNLYYVALANLDATTFSVTSQLRILTTALLAVSILNKILSYAQWGALFLSLIGVVIVQIEKARTSSNPDLSHLNGGNPIVGFSATFAIAWMSSFAGVYFEKVLKESKTDVWIQNIRLALLTIPFSFITMIVSDGKKIWQDGFFQGWTPLVCLVTLLTALGGILVSLVMKYACNVRKTYCQTLSIAATVLISVWLGDVHPSIALAIGVLVTIASVFIYALYPQPPKISDLDRKSMSIDLAKELCEQIEEEEEEEE
ncbi:hypothetical protein PFISCL1PPCAC_15396, partial [Pristionchus fissidentatus]